MELHRSPCLNKTAVQKSYALYTSSVNDLIDAHHQRITFALEYRIPVAILWVLFIVGFLSMLAFGYQFGVSGKGSLQD